MLKKAVEVFGEDAEKYATLKLVKKFIIQFVLLIILIFGALLFYTGKVSNIPFVPKPSHQTQVSINETKINVEVSDTQSKRSKGLGGRENLASSSGMLFIFDREDLYTFWMKGLKFPLDFIWIKGDKVIDLTENVPIPPEGAKDEDLPIYQSKEPIDKLLEVNAGFISTHNIKIGDTVSIQR